jgi:hypothetical protein
MFAFKNYVIDFWITFKRKFKNKYSAGLGRLLTRLRAPKLQSLV